MFKSTYAIKSCVIYYLLQNRRDRKVKKLKDILDQYIQKKNKMNEMARKRKRMLMTLPLEQRLEMLDENKVIKDHQF